MKIYQVDALRSEPVFFADTEDEAIAKAEAVGVIVYRAAEIPLPPGYILIRGWIPIAERKPEYDKDILFRSNLGGERHCFSGRLLSSNRWFCMDDNWRMGNNDDWMEIPE